MGVRWEGLLTELKYAATLRMCAIKMFDIWWNSVGGGFENAKCQRNNIYKFQKQLLHLLSCHLCVPDFK